MARAIVTALLCLPCAANAEKLLVEYEGSVSSIERGSSLAETAPYSVGDAIRGSLLIDTALAPTDSVGADAEVGRYYHGVSSGLDFILGAPHPPGRRGPADFVIVHNDWAPPSAGAPREDGWIINDSSIGSDGDFNLLLGLQRSNPFGQVFSSDSLLQSFAVEREAGTHLWGFIERGFGEFWSMVNFTVDRLSVKAGACRA